MAIFLSTGKKDLLIEPPLMNAAGCLGFSDEARQLIDPSRLGAFITNPVSLVRRTPARGPRHLAAPGGFLLHTGHPNPGLSTVISRHLRRWAAMPCPVIVHLLTQRPGEAAEMAERLEAVEEVDGLELGLESRISSEITRMVSAAASGELPLLVQLPLDVDEEAALAAVQAGADGLSLGPPRGTLPAPGGEIVHGRLYGPALFPLTLRATYRLGRLVQCPLIVGGGIYTRNHIEAVLAAGAAGVQLDSVLWTEPERLLGGQGDSRSF